MTEKILQILTICPEYFDSFKASHVAVRAEKLALAKVEITDIRNYAGGSFRHVDDSPYGGGNGMILRAAPIAEALRASGYEKAHTVFLAPHGKPYKQEDARRLAREDHLILVCGHYEGIDERAYAFADEIISLGDYILTGGEPAAVVVADSLLRLLDGNLKPGSCEDESFENGLLEYPQYTRPLEFEGRKVPEILLSGNHGAVARWRKEESLRRTKEYRPDLLKESE